MSTPLIELKQVTKRFRLPQGDVTVLENIGISARAGEFIAIVGPSGSGKSTLLRLMNGLLMPSEGQVLYRGDPFVGVNLNTAIVFQNFGLLPWLTVQQNVRLGLESRSRDERMIRRKTALYIEKVGLKGYEEAYPRELSGGMKQRVGLARALVIEPEVLLMDEPFSSVDILTSINLRDELVDIWSDPEVQLNTLVLVTHQIEEAVELADRILILSGKPGVIAGEIAVDLPRPREKRAKEFMDYVDKVFSLLA